MLNPKANRRGSILHAINLKKDFRPAAAGIFRISRLTPRNRKSVGDRPRLIRFIDILFNDSTPLRELLYLELSTLNKPNYANWKVCGLKLEWRFELCRRYV